jgi:hypothetical protein
LEVIWIVVDIKNGSVIIIGGAAVCSFRVGKVELMVESLKLKIGWVGVDI